MTLYKAYRSYFDFKKPMPTLKFCISKAFSLTLAFVINENVLAFISIIIMVIGLHHYLRRKILMLYLSE